MVLLAFFIKCSMSEKSGDLSSGGDIGQGGSLAGFTIVNDYLYTIAGKSHIKIANISDPASPVYQETFVPGFGIETTFPRGNNLFIGANNGMYIYDLSNAVKPTLLSFYQHIFSCDPVVADEKYAYVTMNSVWGNCGQNNNELQIVDIADLKKPKMVFRKQLQSPRGLSIQNDTLIICDNSLKFFKVDPDRKNITLISEFNIEAIDIISLGKVFMVIGEKGFYQYSIKNNEIKLLSSILKK